MLGPRSLPNAPHFKPVLGGVGESILFLQEPTSGHVECLGKLHEFDVRYLTQTNLNLRDTRAINIPTIQLRLGSKSCLSELRLTLKAGKTDALATNVPRAEPLQTVTVESVPPVER